MYWGHHWWGTPALTIELLLHWAPEQHSPSEHPEPPEILHPKPCHLSEGCWVSCFLLSEHTIPLPAKRKHKVKDTSSWSH